MKISLDPQNRLELNSETISLRAGIPLMNGRRLDDWLPQTQPQEDGFTVVYTSPSSGSGSFGLEVHNPALPGEPGWLQYWLEGVPEDLALDSFGLYFAAVDNVQAYFRQGYQSWDGSYYVQVEGEGDQPNDAARVVQGYAATQFLPRLGSQKLLLGFNRHDRFQQTFTFHHRSPLEFSIETLWDQKEQRGMQRCSSERLLILTNPSAEAGLKAWAVQVASACPPPAAHLPAHSNISRLTGWSSWYNLYASITEENILEYLVKTARVARRNKLPMRVFQIDDGFTPEMGDWLETRPQFPRGMKPLMDAVRSEGFIPGLWIAPFMVGNRSRLYRDHPDWVVQDREKGGPLSQLTFYGEFRWHKRSEEYYILDTTHPEAFDYLRLVFRTWRQEWGCEYFKTDFMFFGSENGPQRAVWHTPGFTRIEVWRRAAVMIREELGDALWLGCGCPLWAAAGLVDGMRIGGDVGVRWQGDSRAVVRLRDTATRNFTNGILWQSDPDVVLLREKFHHLEEAEVNSLALYSGLTRGILMTSDDLEVLPETRLRLWKLLLSLSPGECRFPMLEVSAAAYARSDMEMGRTIQGTDTVLVQVLSGRLEPFEEIVFCFNLDDLPVQRTYPLAALGLTGKRYIFEWASREISEEPVHVLSMELSPHEGRLFFLSSRPVSELPDVSSSFGNSE